ncbi:MAG: hypothetical protein IJA76_03455 [Clostridia bacterium]|nr:hypothetical protein [Clostridia bacterium]MBQ4587352.1 hypothetical protein [Clostridia bacterium]
MNIIEWLNTNFDAGDAIIYGLIALVIWSIIWRLFIVKVFGKTAFISDLMNEHPRLASVASFGILLFFSVIVVLLISSIQAGLEYGAKMIFMLLIFWGVVITFFVLLIRKITKNK